MIKRNSAENPLTAQQDSTPDAKRVVEVFVATSDAYSFVKVKIRRKTSATHIEPDPGRNTK